MWNNAFWRRIFWIFIFYLFEVTFGARMGAFAPPLVLAAVVGIALEDGPAAGFGWGAAAGLLFEPFATGALGVAPFAYALAGWITGALTSKMFGESFWVRALWPCVALAVTAAVEAMSNRSSEAGFWQLWFAAAPAQRFLVTAAVTPWVVSQLRSRPNALRRTRPLYQ